MRLGGYVKREYNGADEWIAAAQELGYRAVPCPIDHRADEAVIRAFADAARAHDIAISEVGAWGNPISQDEHTRKQAILFAQKQLELAEKIEARVCVNITGSRGEQWDGPHPDNLTDDTFALIVDSVREIIDAVKPRRTFYALEMMPWAYPDSADSYLKLIEAIDRPQLAVHFDPVNIINSPEKFYRNGEIIRDFIRRLGGKIRNCHAKDIILHGKLTVHLNQLMSAQQPTMYFIGVTTGQSSIMKLFPLWAPVLGLGDAVIKGIDIEIHADPDKYRQVVEFIKHDKLSLGALVTTHKIDLYHAASDLFDRLDPYAELFGELSCISKREDGLVGHAKDPITSGLAMEAFIPQDWWRNHKGELFIMGAGGSAIAICSYLLQERHGDNIPSRIVVTNRSEPRLREIERIVRTLRPDVRAEFHLTPEAGDNDRVLQGIAPHSLIVNATGLGKDRPGSPLTDDAVFPENSLVWELNYRGDLKFMKQAQAVQQQRKLYIEDGWVYFLHGWTQVIAEVFDVEITPERFEQIEKLSNSIRG